MIYNRLMYIHVTRSSGNAFFNVMSRVKGLEVWREDKAHPSYDNLADWCVAHSCPVPPAVTFIRCPWDWYVAMWAWVCMNDLKGFHGSFEDYMRIVHEEARSDRAFRSLSWRWADQQCDKAQYVGQLEYFRSDVARILLDIVPDLVTPCEAHDIVRVPEYRPVKEPNPWLPRADWRVLPRHESRHFHTEQTREWVAELDAELIERFGYRI